MSGGDRGADRGHLLRRADERPGAGGAPPSGPGGPPRRGPARAGRRPPGRPRTARSGSVTAAIRVPGSACGRRGHHGRAAAGVHGEEVGLQVREAARRPGHRVGDVVQLEVQEQPAVRALRPGPRRRPGRRRAGRSRAPPSSRRHAGPAAAAQPSTVAAIRSRPGRRRTGAPRSADAVRRTCSQGLLRGPPGAARRAACDVERAWCTWPRPTASDSAGDAPRGEDVAQLRGDAGQGACGSLKTTVPTDTALAPASRNSKASWPVRMPPMPEDRQASGSAACTCHTARTATGRIAGPDRPPVIPPSIGRMVSGSITIPSRVLIMRRRPSAPASTDGPGDRDDVGDVRAELGQDRDVRGGVPAHDLDHGGRGERVAGEHLTAGLDVRAARC